MLGLIYKIFQSVCPPPLPCPLPACPVCQLCSLPPPCPLPPIPVCPAPQPVQLQLPCTCGAAQGRQSIEAFVLILRIFFYFF